MQLPLAMSTKRISVVKCFNYPIRLRIRFFTDGNYAPFVYCILSCSVDTIEGRYESSVSVQVKYRTLWLFVSTFDTKSLYYIWKRWTCEIYWISFETLCILTSYPITSRLRNSFTPSTFLNCLWSAGSSSSHCLARRVAFRSSSISAVLMPSLNLIRDCTCARSLRVWCTSFWRCARASSRASFVFVSATSWTLSPSRDFVPFGA